MGRDRLVVLRFRLDSTSDRCHLQACGVLLADREVPKV